ncbi:MAG: DUF434 domain-containing protein [Microscillaceae bacterium]|nr:DUF434 domain-containing protein [Microscillaceae bacterium]MDW8459584.1 DUF434 domain-containing protein [Cytophagales bacterium]
MPNKQKHRGQHPEDAYLFNEQNLLKIRMAVADLSFLLSKNYPENASLKLVGDHYRLNARQRQALLRSACSDSSIIQKQKNEITVDDLSHQEVWIDTYNLLILIETALSQGLIFICRDNCYRDIASVHGTYRKVEETLPAIQLIIRTLQKLQVSKCVWYLDSPIANSGRLSKIILQESQIANLPAEAFLVHNPDKILVETDRIVISTDSRVIEKARRWFNLGKYIIDYCISKPQMRNIS